MNTDRTPPALGRYLGALDASLADAPAPTRSEILADVRAHVEDAVDQGRSLDDVLSGLGDARSAAAQYRVALGLPEEAPVDALRATRLFHGASVAVGVLTGCLVAFLLPAFLDPALVAQSIAGSAAEEPTGASQRVAHGSLAARFGLGAALLAFLPALLAALPLVLPPALPPVARTSVSAAGAIVVTVLAVLGGFDVGAYYAPLAVLMWASVVVPWRVRHGLDLERSPLWRVLGGVLVAIPGLLIFAGLFSGALALDLPALLIPVAIIALGALFAIGVRAVYPVVAALGLAVMVLALVDLGLLTLAFWWTGGAFLVLGLTAVAAVRPRRGDRRGREA